MEGQRAVPPPRHHIQTSRREGKRGSALRQDFAESTLAEIPTFIVRSAQAIAPATAKDQASPFTLRKLLEPEWVEIEL
jgi:hypothetical protein